MDYLMVQLMDLSSHGTDSLLDISEMNYFLINTMFVQRTKCVTKCMTGCIWDTPMNLQLPQKHQRRNMKHNEGNNFLILPYHLCIATVSMI